MTKQRTDLIVIASAKARPGREADLERALREVGGPTRQQPGCVEFALHRRQDDRTTLIGFERWASAEAHGRHLQGAHVARLLGQMADLLAEPPVITTYEVVDETN